MSRISLKSWRMMTFLPIRTQLKCSVKRYISSSSSSCFSANLSVNYRNCSQKSGFTLRRFSAGYESSISRKRIIAALVINTPGTLAQVSELFSYGSVNIQSLVVSPTEVPELSRMSVVCSTSDEKIQWIQEKLEQLVSVALFHISPLDSKLPEDTRKQQTLVLAKVKVTQETYEDVIKLIADYGASIIFDSGMIDAKGGYILMEAADSPDLIDELIYKLNKYCILELHRSGPISLCARRSTVEVDGPNGFTPSVNPEVLKISAGESSVKSTAELHTTSEGKYTAERLELHRRIAKQLFSTSRMHLAHPKFVLLIGIPGSGKSTILSHLDALKTIELSSFVNLDIDNCIALLPEFYHLVLDIGLGRHSTDFACPHTRYKMCVDEAKFILRKNRDAAISNRQNIILHGSGKSFENYHSLLNQVISAGYETHIVCVDVPMELALKRVRQRSNGYGRDVPISIIKRAASKIVDSFPKLAKLSKNAHLFDSTHRPPQLIWSKQKSQISFSNNDHWLLDKFSLQRKTK